MPNLTINGQSYFADATPDTPLLWVIREDLRLTGTKYGCGIACVVAALSTRWAGGSFLLATVGSVEGSMITRSRA